MTNINKYFLLYYVHCSQFTHDVVFLGISKMVSVQEGAASWSMLMELYGSLQREKVKEKEERRKE